MSRTAKISEAKMERAVADGGDALDLGVLNDVMGFRLRRLQNHLAKTFMEDPRHGDLKSGQFSIMALIAANPGVSQVRVAQEAGIDKTAMVALIDHLEDAGWVIRARARDDRRKHSLHMTSKGLKALETLTEAAHETEARIRGVLSADQLDQLLGILDRLYAASFREDEL